MAALGTALLETRLGCHLSADRAGPAERLPLCGPQSPHLKLEVWG